MKAEINLSRLPGAVKKQVWAAIQAERPDLADLLGSEDFQATAAAFGGQVVVKVADLPKAAVEAIERGGMRQ